MNAQAKTTTLRTVDIAYIGLFVAVMAICSWISIPAAVPFTLQTFAVFMAVGLLGGKRGTIAVLTYVLLEPLAFRYLPDFPVVLAPCSAIAAVISLVLFSPPSLCGLSQQSLAKRHGS